MSKFRACILTDFPAGYDECLIHALFRKLYLRSNGPTAHLAETRNLPFWHECFLDRAYESDASLRARHHPDALLPDLSALQQRLELWRDQQALLAHDGALIFLPCQTFCLHSDSALALPFASLAKKFFTVEPSDS